MKAETITSLDKRKIEKCFLYFCFRVCSASFVGHTEENFLHPGLEISFRWESWESCPRGSVAFHPEYTALRRNVHLWSGDRSCECRWSPPLPAEAIAPAHGLG